MIDQRVPLAWLNLTHEPRRLCVAVMGILFAVLLMFVQLGFRGAMFDSTLLLPRKLNGELFILNPGKITLSAKETFARRRLQQALAVEGVADAWPLYMWTLRPEWQNPANGERHPITVYAFDPNAPVIEVAGWDQLAPQLVSGDRVLFDRRSKPEYGRAEPGTRTELSGHRVEVVGNFELGTDFISDGNVILSDLLYRSIFFPDIPGSDPLSAVDLGVLRIAPGYDLRQVRSALLALLEDDVIVLTKDEFIAREQAFWEQATPIGYVFGFGTTLGFAVGVLICYQILYTDVTEHLAEYATLKAMGYSAWFFVRVVVEAAWWVALAGFIPGLLVSLGLYALLNMATGLPLYLGWDRALMVLGLTLAMCTVSGLLTLRHLLAADPAELFK